MIDSQTVGKNGVCDTALGSQLCAYNRNSHIQMSLAVLMDQIIINYTYS